MSVHKLEGTRIYDLSALSSAGGLGAPSGHCWGLCRPCVGSAAWGGQPCRSLCPPARPGRCARGSLAPWLFRQPHSAKYPRGVSASSVLKRSPYENPREGSGAVTRAGKGLGAWRGGLPQEAPGPTRPCLVLSSPPSPSAGDPAGTGTGAQPLPPGAPVFPLFQVPHRCLPKGLFFLSSRFC